MFLYQVVEKLRRKTPRSTFINNTLRPALQKYLLNNTDLVGD